MADRKRYDDLFGFAIDDAVDAPLVLQVLFLDLPRARTADDQLQIVLILLYDRMRREAPKFHRVHRLFRAAVHPRIYVSRERDPKRVMSVEADDTSVGADKQVELIRKANRYILGPNFKAAATR